jgi:zinc transporter ZupT
MVQAQRAALEALAFRQASPGLPLPTAAAVVAVLQLPAALVARAAAVLVAVLDRMAPQAQRTPEAAAAAVITLGAMVVPVVVVFL